MTVVAARLTYGGAVYGVLPYGGKSAATVIPTRNTSGIIFLTSNDRYQVIACANGGSLDTAPEFRYWYAGPPSWAEEINNNDYLPPFYSVDELGSLPAGSLELPYRKLKAPQEMIVSGVVVEFTPHPTLSESISSSETLGFSVQVEGIAAPNYERTVASGVTGVVQSDTITFSESVASQPTSPWPNIRTEWFPCRVGQRCRAARVILTSIELCEIRSVQLIGGTSIPGRHG